jgi:hypothetical protein
MFASASQTAVSWRCVAPHTGSSKGAGGNESSVVSAEKRRDRFEEVAGRLSLESFETQGPKTPMENVPH